MTAYVSRTDDPDIPPPYDFPGITIMSFRLPATLAKLQAVCDEMLNIGSLQRRGFEYRAFVEFVDMEIVTYPKMVFAQPPFSNWGYASQHELYFRFYVWKFVAMGGGILFPEPIPQMFFPFVYVDNSWSMISGRTVIGFPKVMMKLDPKSVLGANPLKISASTQVLTTFSPNTQLDWKPIVQIEPGANQALNAPGGQWPWIGLGAEIADPYLNQLMQALLASIPALFSTVQLKQCRQTVTDACYQAVVETPFTPSNVGVPSALPPVTVTVNPYASLDIPLKLGFPPSQPLLPSLQYSVTLDMGMSAAHTLFVNA